MKYIILVPDGVADEPLAELGNRTPLEAAKTPNMDRLVNMGQTGLVQIIPKSMAPGSDVGNMSVLGYDATKGFSGRAPLEAANLGIELQDDELAFRCNLVHIADARMVDYSSGHITSSEAEQIVRSIDGALSDNTFRFYPGKSYRHILVVKTTQQDHFMQTVCTPPHDIMGKAVVDHLPNGPMGSVLVDLMKRSKDVLADHPVNKSRIARGELPVTSIWLWGQGGRPDLETFKERYGIEGSMISAVDLVNGIGRVIGLDVISVPGATGYYDTNYQGKAEYGIASLANKDLTYIHVEATDEAGHNGDVKAKVECIEKFDEFVVGTALKYYHDHPSTRILVTPDHPTPIAKRTHTMDPVPFVMCGKGIEQNDGAGYNERSALDTGLFFSSGVEMIRHFMWSGEGKGSL